MRRVRKKDLGFTLVELVIAVTIVAILARVAMFAYIGSVEKAARSDAKNALTQAQQAEERCYSQYFVYNNAACPGQAGTPPISLANSPNKYYSISITALTSTAYTIQAIPISGTVAAKDTQCASFTVNQSGTQAAANSVGAPNNSYCWTGHN